MVKVYTTTWCAIDGCSRKVLAKTMCGTHYMRQHRGNDPHQPTHKDPRPAVVRDGYAYLPLNHNAVSGYAKVDLKNRYLDKHNWTKKHDGYAVALIGGKNKYLHRLIMDEPAGVVDHINRDTSDCTLSNLRVVSHRENILNTGMYRHNTSGVKGVYRQGKSWVANICINKKTHYLGRSTDKNIAIKLRQTAERELGYSS